MKIKDLKEYHKNPRKMTEEDFDLLKDTLKKYGDLSGIVFNVRNQQLVGGHRRSDAFRDGDPEIEITQRFDPPTPTGTVAVGYVIVDGERFSYREVDWDDLMHEGANIVANKVGGTWDFDKLANEFSLDLLKETGWKEFELSFVSSGDDDSEGNLDRTPMAGSAETYLAGAMKQITLVFTKEEFDKIMTRVEAAKDDFEVESNADLFVKLLDEHESNRG
jgi:hypothetical protein